jgi:hypothetical protein
MAKSIRSKVMRKHRTALRKAICEPLERKRQEQLAATLEENLREKNGKTITNLKSVFEQYHQNNNQKNLSLTPQGEQSHLLT